MIKKILMLVIAALIAAGCKNNNIEVNGKLSSPSAGHYLYLDELRSTELITVDSAIVKEDGTFSIKRKVKYPSFYLLKTDETNFLMLLVEPQQKIDIRAYHDSLNFPSYLSGSPGSELMNQYNMKLQNTQGRLKKLYDVYIENQGTDQVDSVMERLYNVAQIYLDDLNKYTKKYIDENLNSLVSLVALYQQIAPGEYILHPEKDLEYFIKVDSSLSLLYPHYEPVKSLHEQVSRLVADIKARKAASPDTEEGDLASEIALPDTGGDTVRLSSTKGNVVLLDFWASWCKPCRDESPNLVRAYNLYHSRGFQIYQVSLDKTKEAWLKGISEDNLERWIHVSDLKYWQSVVVPLYNIEFIPCNYLLDREGRIIANDLRGEELQRTLASIFISN